MAETPSPPHTPPPSPPQLTPPSVPDHTEYWCYQCDKRVRIQTLPDVICFECKNGFVELRSLHHHQPLEVNDEDQHAISDEFRHFLTLIAMTLRDNDAPPSGHTENDADDNEDEGDENPNQENHNEADRVHEDEDFRRREIRNCIRIRFRGMAAQAYNRGHRAFDWADILSGIEDRTIEISFHVPGDGDGYTINPGDYAYAAALFQNLVERYYGGAPPAAKSAVEALPIVEVKSSNIEVCAVCKDKLFNSEEEIVKQLPCGHMYHEDCIMPWLVWRNTCPVCRHELHTDDSEYEEERKKRSTAVDTTSSGDRL